MNASVHDNFLTAYSVDSDSKQIRFQTHYPYGDEPFERTEVIFDGVIDHYFRCTLLPAIIFDIEEADPQFVLTNHLEAINEGHKDGGWPSFWKPTVDEMVAYIEEQSLKVYSVESSYGLDGWVVASNFTLKSL